MKLYNMNIAKLTVITSLLHLVWENAQAPLYAEYQSFWQHFPSCVVGTVGDVIITLFVLFFIRLLKKNSPHSPTDFFVLAIIGFFIAVMIEQHALLIGQWDYTSAMPIIPFLKVGLIPILQMTLLLPLSFYLARLTRTAKK